MYKFVKCQTGLGYPARHIVINSCIFREGTSDVGQLVHVGKNDITNHNGEWGINWNQAGVERVPGSFLG